MPLWPPGPSGGGPAGDPVSPTNRAKRVRGEAGPGDKTSCLAVPANPVGLRASIPATGLARTRVTDRA